MPRKSNGPFLSDFPDLMKDWDHEANEWIDPSTLTFGSNRCVNWLCHKCGGKWETKVCNRTVLKRGCPYCSPTKARLLKGYNDLATTHPELAKQWDYEANAPYTPDQVLHGTRKQFYWICPICGLSYKASCNKRSTPSAPTGCPRCLAGRQTSFAEQAIFYYLSRVYPDAISRYKADWLKRYELDIYIPSLKIGIEYDGVFYHKGEASDRKAKEKWKLCRNNGVRLWRIYEGKARSFPYADQSLAIEGNEDGRNKFLHPIIQEIIFELTKFQPWLRKNTDVNIDRDRSDILAAYHNGVIENAFPKKYPELLKEWDYEANGKLNPYAFSAGSTHKVHWKCSKCGNKWVAQIGHVTRGTGCPKCGIRKSTAKKQKRVCQYSLEGKFIKEWVSVSEAARSLSKNSSNISMCCKGVRPTAGGYRWDYERKNTLGPLSPKVRKTPKRFSNSKYIYQYDLEGNFIAKFDTLREASKALGINSGTICHVCQGEMKQTNGFIFRYQPLVKED